MSAVFRLEHADSVEVSEAWELAQQIDDASRWLDDPGNAERVRGSVLDIGFNSRLDNDKVAIQGEVVPLGFMQRLVALDITLWLSLYPSFSTPMPNPDSN